MSFQDFNERNNTVKFPTGIYISCDLTSASELKINQYINAYLSDI